jgi:hypothetical protein
MYFVGRETTALVDKDLRIAAIIDGGPGSEEKKEEVWEEVCKAVREELIQVGKALGEGKMHHQGKFHIMVIGFSFGE